MKWSERGEESGGMAHVHVAKSGVMVHVHVGTSARAGVVI